MDSVLITIKSMLGIAPEDDAFDMEIIVHINSIISILKQLGVECETEYIAGPKTKWNDVFPKETRLELIKTYMYIRIRLLFDPPSSSATATAFENMAKEYEWRLNANYDFK